jgi:predicted O-methyltransferase YrrM
MLPVGSNFKVYEKTVPTGTNILIHEHKSPYQLIRLFKNDLHFWMSLNGEMQFHTAECEISHKYMCIKALELLGRKPGKVLVIGGGDGLPTKLLLQHVECFTQVELDPDLVSLTKTHPVMRKISGDSFNHPRVDLKVGDGIQYLLDSEDDTYDLIIDDCDFGVSNQPRWWGAFKPGDDNQRKYKAYKEALVDKLAPGGIAVYMENIEWPWREIGKKATGFMRQWSIDNVRQWKHGSAKDRFLALDTAIKEDISDWTDEAPFLTSEMVILPVIGPEHYIYMSNQPFRKMRSTTSI